MDRKGVQFKEKCFPLRADIEIEESSNWLEYTHLRSIWQWNGMDTLFPESRIIMPEKKDNIVKKVLDHVRGAGWLVLSQPHILAS